MEHAHCRNRRIASEFRQQALVERAAAPDLNQDFPAPRPDLNLFEGKAAREPANQSFSRSSLGEKNERLAVIALYSNSGTLDFLHDDHATPGRDRLHGSLLIPVAQGQLVGVGMLRAVTHVANLHLDPCLLDFLTEVRKTLIIRFPAHQAAKESQVRSLRLMRGDQCAVGIIFHHHLLQIASHQVTRQSPDPQRGRAVRTRRPPHHGAEHIVEDTGGSH